MKYVIFLLALLWTSTAAAQDAPKSYGELLQEARAAFGEQDWTALSERLDAAQEQRPYSLYVMRNRILAYALKGDEDKAVALAQKAADRGLAFNLAGNPAYEPMAARADFTAILGKMEENAKAQGDASVVLEHEDASLLPEALAFDRKGNAYVGSVRTGKILKINKKGEATGIAFAPGGVFDIELRGNTLWAVVNNQLAFENADPENKFASVMAFDLKTGAAKSDVRITEDDALLGDLEVAKDGTLYASDSVTPRLYKIAPGGEQAMIFAEDPRFANLQGIALDEKNNRLFVADYLTGVFSINTETGAVAALENTADAHLGGIDGLYLSGTDLIGVQNGSTPRRVVKLTVNEDASAITNLTVLHQNLDEWTEPTHGVVRKRGFDYIATSNWPAYGADGSVKEDAELAPLRILRAPLD